MILNSGHLLTEEERMDSSLEERVYMKKKKSKKKKKRMKFHFSLLNNLQKDRRSMRS